MTRYAWSTSPASGGGEESEAEGNTPASLGPRRLISTGRDIRREGGLHTLYISPLKALAVDIARNLERPVAEMGLPIRIETRTGDTPASKRQRQRRDPPHILLTTPEQLALILASPDAPYLFGSLRRVVLDELHALVTSKRGDLCRSAWRGCSRWRPRSPASAFPRRWPSPTICAAIWCRKRGRARRDGSATRSPIWSWPKAAPRPHVTMLDTAEHLPWAGHSAQHAIGEIYELIKRHKTTLVFVNTRSQAESIFQELWRINDDSLAIALHHGSLDVAQRRKVEAAMATGRLRAVVATSSLDLGVDWGDVDLVINVGAPKGASRLLQRIGRANHRMDEPSRGVLIPANRFEVLECRAALDAIAENAQDTPAGAHRRARRAGAARARLRLRRAVPRRRAFRRGASAAPYAGLARADFDAALDFVATGGYALKAYERFAKIRQGKDGRWRVTHPMIAQRYRMNVGTIVEADMLKVRLVRSRASKMIPRGGRLLGEVEEYFIEMLTPGDTFVFAGEILRYEALVSDEVYVSRATSEDPKVPSYEGGKFPLSTYLADRVRQIFADDDWRALPDQVREWLEIQEWRSLLPGPARPPGRNLSARQQALPRLLPVRRPARAPDARHAAHAPARTRAPAPARLRRQRICARGLGPGRRGAAHRARRVFARGAVRRGHAGRRPRSLARRIRADEAHLPHLRDHRRPDRAPLPRQGEIAPRGHDLDRPRLRRAAQAPGRPHPAARRARRRRDRPPRHPPARRNALAHQGPNRP